MANLIVSDSNFIKTEMALCFTLSTIVAQKYKIDTEESAEESMANR
jgi:hypothetical protein